MKKLLTVILCIIISCCYLSVNMFAADCGLICTDSPGVDEEFDVSVTIANNPGVVSIVLEIRYPSDKISLVSCNDDGLFDIFHPYVNPSDTDILMLTLSTENGSLNNYSTGTIATLTFTADDTSDGMALISVSCISAFDYTGANVTFNGVSTAVIFAEEEVEEIVDEEINDDDEVIEDEEIIEEEEEVIEDEEVTTTTKKTEATTTTKKTEATTTTKKTEATTTTPVVTTSEEPVTTPEVTSAPESSDTVSSSAPESSVQVTGSSNQPIETGNDYSFKASKTTVVLAVSILLTAILFAVGIEIYKRYFMVNDEQPK